MRHRIPADARYPVFRVLLVLLLPLLLSSCWFSQSKLRAVKSAGELVVLTRVSPTTYYESPEGLAGFEYDLAKEFADHLGVKLRMVPAARFAIQISLVVPLCTSTARRLPSGERRGWR